MREKFDLDLGRFLSVKDEKPIHEAKLDSLYMNKLEVTNKLYENFRHVQIA